MKIKFYRKTSNLLLDDFKIISIGILKKNDEGWILNPPIDINYNFKQKQRKIDDCM